MNKTTNQDISAARELLASLEQQFPIFRTGNPLAIGIDKQLIERLTDINKKTLRTALRLHTHSTRYLKAVEKAQHRFDLEGNIAGDMPDEHRVAASEMLKERYKKMALQRKEKAKSEKENQERQVKLQQLTEKFSPRR
jgi:ProP effector